MYLLNTLIVILSNLKKSDMRSFPRLDPPKSKVEGINVYSTYNEQHIIYKLEYYFSEFKYYNFDSVCKYHVSIIIKLSYVKKVKPNQ